MGDLLRHIAELEERVTTVDTQEQGPQSAAEPTADGGYHKKKWCMLAVGDSLLRGTEGPVCWLDESCRVCCLPGAKICDGEDSPVGVRMCQECGLLSAITLSCWNEQQ